MSLFNNFPYSWQHQLNLDWMCKKLKDIPTEESTRKLITEIVQSDAPAIVAKQIVDKVFPIGSYWISERNISPATIFPNTRWRRIEDVMLRAAGSDESAGTISGSNTAKIEVENLPKVSSIYGEPACSVGVKGASDNAYGSGYQKGSNYAVILNTSFVSDAAGNDQSRVTASLNGKDTPLNITNKNISVYMWQRI